MGDDGVISLTSFPVIDEQLSGDVIRQAEEHFKAILKEVAGDYFKKYNDIDDFVEDRKYIGDDFIVQIVCSYIDC